MTGLTRHHRSKGRHSSRSRTRNNMTRCAGCCSPQIRAACSYQRLMQPSVIVSGPQQMAVRVSRCLAAAPAATCVHSGHQTSRGTSSSSSRIVTIISTISRTTAAGSSTTSSINMSSTRMSAGKAMLPQVAAPGQCKGSSLQR